MKFPVFRDMQIKSRWNIRMRSSKTVVLPEFAVCGVCFLRARLHYRLFASYIPGPLGICRRSPAVCVVLLTYYDRVPYWIRRVVSATRISFQCIAVTICWIFIERNFASRPDEYVNRGWAVDFKDTVGLFYICRYCVGNNDISDGPWGKENIYVSTRFFSSVWVVTCLMSLKVLD